MKVIRPDGDEVGVFLSQDALDLPYESAVESDRAGNQGSEVRLFLSFLTIGMLIFILIPLGATTSAPSTGIHL